MPTCNHEEVDTRMLVHMLDAVADDPTTGLVHTVGTDVVVIFVGMLNRLLMINPYVGDIWEWKEFPHSINGFVKTTQKMSAMTSSFVIFTQHSVMIADLTC